MIAIIILGIGDGMSLPPWNIASPGTTLEIGQMITIAGLATFLISVPNGVVMDRWGRKATLLPGLAILSLASYMMAGVNDYLSVLVAIIILGIGDGMSLGTAQVLAMDLAPRDRRGAFLGAWQLLTSLGGIAVPLALGTYAQMSGTAKSFVAVSICLLVAVPVLGFFGPETRKTNARRDRANTFYLARWEELPIALRGLPLRAEGHPELFSCVRPWRINEPGGFRTHDPRIKSPLLYR